MPTDPGYRKVYTKTTTKPSSVLTGANRFEARAAGTPPKDTTDWIALYGQGQQPPAPPTPVLPGNLANRSGRGGGRAAGPTPEQVKAAANEVFNFNAGPYDLMRQQVGNQRGQVQGYNPNFAQTGQDFTNRMQKIDQERAANVQRRLQEMATFGQTLAAQQGTAMQGALRDLTAQGINVQPYINQANQLGADRTGALANQQNYMGQLDLANANAVSDYSRASGLITQGAEANLANNRGAVLNQLAQQEAQIGLQQAQAQQQNEQARREFMLKYGVL